MILIVVWRVTQTRRDSLFSDLYGSALYTVGEAQSGLTHLLSLCLPDRTELREIAGSRGAFETPNRERERAVHESLRAELLHVMQSSCLVILMVLVGKLITMLF